MPEKIFDTIRSNLKNPKLYVLMLAILIVILVLFPYIDANIFYFNRVKNRIEILEKMSEFNTESIESIPALKNEYDSILNEIENQSNGSLGSIFIKETDKTINTIKFVTGGFLVWLLAIACFFMKRFKNLGHRIATIILLTIVGGITGGISRAIPTLITPMVNYIGFPLLLIILLALLATSNSKEKKKEANADA